LLASFLIGVAMGNIVRGIPLDQNHEFTGTLLGLLNPYSLFFGVTTVMLFAMHGSIYVVMKTEGVLQEKIRSWIPKLITLFIGCYLLFNIYTLLEIDWVAQVLEKRPWVVAVVTLNALVVLNIPREIRLGREFLAFLSSCAGMVLMMATFGLTYFPYMVRSNPQLENSLTVINAASTEKTLGIMLVIALIGVPVVLAYTACIYYIFRGKVKLTSHSY
jgi:cytochrome d ubiquinol oxidase subunit II